MIYWYDEIYSSRVEATARMLGQYTLYYLIFPQLERNIKLRYANTEFFNAIIKERERYEERRKKAEEKFYDFGFIFCSETGNARNKSFHYKRFKRILREDCRI